MKSNCSRAAKIVAYFFAVLFSFATVQKCIDFGNFRAQLQSAPALEKYGELTAFLIVTGQVLIVGLLCWRKTRHTGFFLTVLLLTVFTAYTAMILMERHVPCECLGIVKGFKWQQIFFLHLFFLLVAFLGFVSSGWESVKK